MNKSKSCVLHAITVKRTFFRSMEVLEYGPVGSGVSDIPGSDPWIFQSSSYLADDSHDGFSMTIDSNIWSSRSGCCYLSRVSAVSRKPNVLFKRHGEGWREIILSMTAALMISLSLCCHCCLACVCRSSRMRNAQYCEHLNYVISSREFRELTRHQMWCTLDVEKMIP